MNKAVLIVVALVLVVAVGAGAFFLGKSAGSKDEAKTEEKPAAAAAAPAPAAKPEEAKAEAAPPPPPPREVEDAAKPPGWPVFSIELASFRDLDRARDYLGVMQQRKLQAELVETLDAGGRKWYHVRVGKYDDPRQAAAQLPEVDSVAGIYGIVTTEIPNPQSQGK